MVRSPIDHPLQAIMSRTGSFPLRVAYNLLKEYGKRQTIVFDPFCGKGTTLLAARMLGYHAYGMDIAPEAVICTLSKLVDTNLESVHRYIKTLSLNNQTLANVPNDILNFFHPSTLKQILSIRDRLIRDVRSKNKNRRANAHFVLANLLGILHGHASYSLSIPSAHAYSMSPAYVAKFAMKHGLKAPIRDVRSCLAEKISRCLSIPPPNSVEFAIKLGSALHCTTMFPELVGKVQLILTSPPYLNAQTYAKDNWLRLWLLGYDYKAIRNDYIETGSINRYENYMEQVFKEIYIMMKSGGRLICIAGDVRLNNHNGSGLYKIFQTGTFLAELCGTKEIGFKIERYEVHNVPSNNRYFHALNGSNGHSKRDLVERVFVARKP